MCSNDSPMVQRIDVNTCKANAKNIYQGVHVSYELHEYVMDRYEF